MSNFLKDSPLLSLSSPRSSQKITCDDKCTRGVQAEIEEEDDDDEGRSSDEDRDEKAKEALCALIPQSTEVPQQTEE